MRHTLIALVLFSLTSTLAHAKALADTDKARALADAFMQQLTSGEVEAGYSTLSAYVGVDFEQFNARGKKMLSDLQQIETRVGKPLSYDHLATQAVKQHLLKLTYLLKYPSAAVIWEFNFYQPQNGWQLVDVSYHTNINALFSLPADKLSVPADK